MSTFIPEDETPLDGTNELGTSLEGFIEYLTGTRPEYQTGNIESGMVLAYHSACQLLTDALENAYKPVPASVLEQMVYEVGHAIFKRKSAYAASDQYESNGASFIGPYDPMSTVMPTLRRYIGLGF